MAHFNAVNCRVIFLSGRGKMKRMMGMMMMALAAKAEIPIGTRGRSARAARLCPIVLCRRGCRDQTLSES